MKRFLSIIIFYSVLLVCCRNTNYTSLKQENDEIYFACEYIIKNQQIIDIISQYIENVENRKESIYDSTFSKYNMFYQLISRKIDINTTEYFLTCIEASTYAFNKFKPSSYIIVDNKIVLIYTGFEDIFTPSIDMLNSINLSIPNYVLSEPNKLLMYLDFATWKIIPQGDNLTFNSTLENPFGLPIDSTKKYIAPVIIDYDN